MCEKFRRNRESLVNLIYGMEIFTEDALLKEFWEQRGQEIAIDGVQTIGDFLEELTEFGVLTREYGIYRTQPV